jgi:hypothetical protein
MGNSDDMEVGTNRGHGLRVVTDKSERQEAWGNKGGAPGENENERESSYSKSNTDQHSKQSRNINDANKGDWIPVWSKNKNKKRKDDMVQDGVKVLPLPQPHLCAHGRTDKSKRPESHPTKECARACVLCLKSEPKYYYCPITLVMAWLIALV